MLDYLIHFFSYNKIYLYTGLLLLLLVVLPTKGKMSSRTRGWLYVAVVIWIICFAYRVNTGNDIISLSSKKDTSGDETRPMQGEKGPFSKYYSNDAGRKAKTDSK